MHHEHCWPWGPNALNWETSPVLVSCHRDHSHLELDAGFPWTTAVETARAGSAKRKEFHQWGRNASCALLLKSCYVRKVLEGIYVKLFFLCGLFVFLLEYNAPELLFLGQLCWLVDLKSKAQHFVCFICLWSTIIWKDQHFTCSLLLDSQIDLFNQVTWSQIKGHIDT